MVRRDPGQRPFLDPAVPQVQPAGQRETIQRGQWSPGVERPPRRIDIETRLKRSKPARRGPFIKIPRDDGMPVRRRGFFHRVQLPLISGKK